MFPVINQAQIPKSLRFRYFDELTGMRKLTAAARDPLLCAFNAAAVPSRVAETRQDTPERVSRFRTTSRSQAIFERCRACSNLFAQKTAQIPNFCVEAIR